MEGRCIHLPETASTPVAVARLDGWKWIICTRGYANVVKLSEEEARKHTPASPQNAVWGVLYNIDSEDEGELDKYEGSSAFYEKYPVPNPDKNTQYLRPHLQGDRLYNKLYLPVTVERWLESPQRFGLTFDGVKQPINVLVYVDEKRIEEGNIEHSYIGRMNRAIDQSVPLGIPIKWVEQVMRKWIPEGVKVAQKGFMGSVPGPESSWASTEVNPDEVKGHEKDAAPIIARGM
ncbi:MAG: hypothetical protein Q9227_000396 [Pyrenula ochraceoflavens]